MPCFYEFFAGGGMARLGLGSHWHVLFANDIDKKKAAVYRNNWGDDALVVKDIAAVTTDELLGNADLAWASFPCQDLSLAGSRGGLNAKRSGTFWSFWALMESLAKEHRAPRIIVLENVYGAVRSHEGKDFAAIGEAFARLGYRFGAVLIDAEAFVPQSRLRLFIIGVRGDVAIPDKIVSRTPNPRWHLKGLLEAHQKLSREALDAWVWWRLPNPPERRQRLVDLIEDEPTGVVWHTQEQTRYLLSLMSDTHLAKVCEAQQARTRKIGAVYKRIRRNERGERLQRAEVRFDDIAGCLRTPTGGSSRQTIFVIEGERIRSRLLSPREAARLMGLPDTYKLPEAYNAAYHLAGDGVAVPVVRFLTEQIFEPIISGCARDKAQRAA